MQHNAAGTSWLMQHLKLGFPVPLEREPSHFATIGCDYFNTYFEAVVPADAEARPAGEDAGPVFCMQVFQNSGNPRFDEIRFQSVEIADGFVFVYDVSDPRSLEELKRRFLPPVRNLNGAAPMFLIGTKADLRADQNRAAETFVPTEEAEQWAASEGIIFVSDEVSGRTGDGVQEAFIRVADEMARALGLGAGVAQRVVAPARLMNELRGAPAPPARRRCLVQ
jgi:GTPase SAR1 family protein